MAKEEQCHPLRRLDGLDAHVAFPRGMPVLEPSDSNLICGSEPVLDHDPQRPVCASHRRLLHCACAAVRFYELRRTLLHLELNVLPNLQ